MIYLRTLIVFCFIYLISCGASTQKKTDTINRATLATETIKLDTSNIAPYDFENETESFTLNSKLIEISSLAYSPDDDTFITNDDESGFFFILNSLDFKVKEEFKFGKKGDYESIEKIGDQIVVCKNNGNLYFYNLKTKTTETFKNVLSTRNDVEGLCLDKTKNRLLLACKGEPLEQIKGSKNIKCVYSFDLNKKKLNPAPFLQIHDDTLINFIKIKYSDKSKSQLKKLNGKAKDFAPSGIAIHPKSGDYYIISARGSSIVIMSKEKTFKQIVFLNNKNNPQPEGIAFDTNNNLYISSEGRGFSGKIFKFDYHE